LAADLQGTKDERSEFKRLCVGKNAIAEHGLHKVSMTQQAQKEGRQKKRPTTQKKTWVP